MKYMQNGSVGDIYTASHAEYGATIVEANDSFIEFATSAGERVVVSSSLFQGFDFSSHSTPLTPRFAPGVTVQGYGLVTPPPALGVITGIASYGWEYEDSSGVGHVIQHPGNYKIL